MKNIFFSLFIINTSFVFSIEASNILYKTIERFKGIDRYLLVEINEKKNNGKHKNYNLWKSLIFLGIRILLLWESLSLSYQLEVPVKQNPFLIQNAAKSL